MLDTRCWMLDAPTSSIHSLQGQRVVGQIEYHEKIIEHRAGVWD
jgi:hypothetical protein